MRMRMRFGALVALSVALAPLASDAAPLRLVYEGSVGSVSDGGALALNGITLTTSDRFRVEVVGDGAGSWSGTASVGPISFATEFGSSAANDQPVLGDELVLGASAPVAIAGTSLTVTFFSVRLLDGSATALSAPVFPTSLDLDDWSGRFFLFGGSVPTGETFEVLGTPALATLTQIPEPTSAALLALGLAAIARSRRLA